MYMRFITLLFVACVFGLSSCDPSPEGSANATTITDSVKVNNCITYNHPAGVRTICLDSVTLDSRCPIGFACIRAGEGVCRFVIKRGSETATVTLATIPNTLGAGKYPQEAAGLDVKIKMVSLAPHPNGSYPFPHTPPYADYKAVLEITPL
jgi:hypothetical protein